MYVYIYAYIYIYNVVISLTQILMKYKNTLPRRKVWGVFCGFYYIMAGNAFVVAKEVFNHRNGDILKLWEWINDEKLFFYSKSNYMNKHLYLGKNFSH